MFYEKINKKSSLKNIEDKKIVLNDNESLKKAKANLNNLLTNLSWLKNKTAFLENNKNAFDDVLVNYRMAAFINEVQYDITLDRKVYLRLFKVTLKDDNYKIERVLEKTKISKKDDLVLLAFDGKKILCLNLKNKERSKKIIAKMLKEHLNKGVQLVFMKSPIFGRLKKINDVETKSYTFKKVEQIGNLRNPFKPMTKISNQLLIFVSCFRNDLNLDLQDILNLFVFTRDERTTISKKVDALADYIYEVKEQETKSKKKPKKK